MKTSDGHSIGENGYTSISPYLRTGDREVIEAFFRENRRLKRGDFYRDAILSAIAQHGQTVANRESIKGTGISTASLSREGGIT